MSKTKTIVTASLVATALAAAFGIGTLSAQQPGFTRKVLQQHELSAKGRDAVVALAEFAPGGAVGRHTHPGEEISYVLEGTLILEVDGKPPVTLKAGDSFFVEAGKIHAGKNGGSTPAKVLATYVVEHGKPVSSPAK